MSNEPNHRWLLTPFGFEMCADCKLVRDGQFDGLDCTPRDISGISQGEIRRSIASIQGVLRGRGALGL